MSALKDAVRRSLEQNGLWHTQARLLCGVSGGCDSVTLLRTLHQLQQEMPFFLHACHVQHGLRGEASQADEQFVRELCASLDVPLHVENAGLCGSMHDPGMETLARDRRRTIFLRLMEEKRMDALLLAHHRDDQTETVLMHLLRGAGMEGLCGMKPCVPFGPGLLLRPFLALPRAVLEASGFPHREDESNREAVTPRNALRLQLLPQLEALFPGASAHIAAAAENLAADERFLSDESARLYRSAVCCTAPLMTLSRPLLRSAPEALVRRVLRCWWQEGLAMAGLSPQERSLSRQDTLALLKLLFAQGRESCNLPFGLAAVSAGEFLYLLRQSGQPLREMLPFEETVLPGKTEYLLPHLRIVQAPAGPALPSGSDEIVLSPQMLSLSPVLRPAQPDDRIHPFGAPGSKPLRRFLTDRRIDPVLRRAITVLAVGNDILWIPSLCTAERLRLDRVPDGSVRLTGAHPFIPYRS